MGGKYKHHYTREEARALLPAIRKWLDRLATLASTLRQDEASLTRSLGIGDDLGGEVVNRALRASFEVKEILTEFAEREIEIKDLDRGLIDFPAFVEGREVFLCWEKDEDDINFWHELHTGYAGREPL